ncbi:MAG: glycerate kinase [Candidatus Methanospirare jalkutatii]|nr:glycerate kinase [Candidatus Methanospirare jalkutatii]MCW7079981.1 glycerate kinase [Candidatus Methanospirare jalkutatii]
MEGKGKSEDASKLFSNYEEILANSEKSERRLREDALAILASAVKSADPYGLVCNRVRVEGRTLKVPGENATADVELRGKVRVVAFGKASLGMARAIEEILSVDEGIVVIPRGQHCGSHPKSFEVLEASHPVPDESSVHAAEKALEIARKCEKNDIFIALISGGGSSLLAKPAEGLTLEDKKAVTELLLKSGCTVSELNVVRKKISAVKGGKLAEAAMPAKTLALILSDVVGDPVDAIASGPTAEDTSTFSEAKGVLEKYGVWARIPEGVRNFIERGLAEERRRREKIRSNAQNIIIGNNLVAARAAEEEARARGYNTLLLTTHLEGESREVAKVFVAVARDIRRYGIPVKTPAAVIAGGETTVSVVGTGRGGRNQEFVLSAAIRIASEEGIVVASIGTDGIDGVSEAAGAIADGFTLKRAKDASLDAEAFLRNNDSYTFFSMLNDALLTGRTGTNVNDIAVLLVA